MVQLLSVRVGSTFAGMYSVYIDYSKVQSSNCKAVEVLAEQGIPFAEQLVRWDEMRLSLDFKPRGEPIKPASMEGLFASPQMHLHGTGGYLPHAPRHSLPIVTIKPK
ncbi:hypothetical protein GOP47_0022371 [Adiantum capillus-veneris]|uniref:Uncharacterized protein n=1 Tax=Adiantum capillus-veneris TaxID=13818 RepID=A0A9D4U5M8_ADICA|nr:hypothetical protein GOP47_0022371 [Adiantum capillus-veneris]